nr:unnamed protein product [Callosobruchus chinensis]
MYFLLPVQKSIHISFSLSVHSTLYHRMRRIDVEFHVSNERSRWRFGRNDSILHHRVLHRVVSHIHLGVCLQLDKSTEERRDVSDEKAFT